jgi:hypothetical protein
MTAVLSMLLLAQAAKYTGPVPPKADVPYLLHANKLVEMDAGTASEEKKKDDTLYAVSGATAQAKTPLAEPIMVLKADKIDPDRIALYKFDARGGRREVLIPRVVKRNSLRPIRISVVKLSDRLFKLEAQEFCDIGEYCLSPEGSNQVFCFSVF